MRERERERERVCVCAQIAGSPRDCHRPHVQYLATAKLMHGYLKEHEGTHDFKKERKCNILNGQASRLAPTRNLLIGLFEHSMSSQKLRYHEMGNILVCPV
jgi:hypothetical protein